MNSIATCPSREDLERLFAGQLPLPQVEQLAGHLESCQVCARTVETLPALGAPAGDTLADALRRQSASASGTLEPDLLQLMERLRRLRAPASGTSSSGTAETIAPETGVSTPTGGAAAAARDVSYDFLAPPQAPDEIGRLGPYRVLQVLGQGGMGMVFKAEDPRLDRLCALKTMLPEVARKPEMKERFLREAKAAAKIEHDHIIPIYQVDEAGGVPFIAMPFLQGASLEDWLRKRQQEKPGALLKPQVILKLGREIARGLAAAHAKGMTHRDIKPANIWLDGSAGGRVKILDFGLARLAEAAGEQQLTQSGMIMGTPSYMAPEQARGDKTDGRADLFSLGVILYRLCTGELPFQGRDTLATLMALATRDPPPPAVKNPAVPAALSDLVMRLLVKEREQRIGSAQEVVTAIQAIERELTAPNTAAGAMSTASALTGVPTINATAGPSVASRISMLDNVSAVHARLVERIPPRRRIPLLLAGAAGAAAVVLAGILLFWQTDQGTVRIEINDPQITVQVDGGGAKITQGDKDPIELAPGRHGLRIKVGDLEFETDTFVLAEGKDVHLKVELLAGQVRVADGNQPLGVKRISPEGIASSSVAGPPGEFALAFDGQKALVHLDTPTMDASRSLTYEAWVLPETQDSLGKIFSCQVAAMRQWNTHWTFTVMTESKLSTGQDKWTGVRSADGTAQPKWTHLAATWDAPTKEMSLFVDGVLVDRKRVPKTDPQADPRLTIGAHQVFHGRMSELRISSVVRYASNFSPPGRHEPDAQTIALYHCDDGAGAVLTDSSGNGHHGKIDGATWVRTDSVQATATSDGQLADAPPPAVAPFDAAQAKAHQEAWAAHLGVPVEYTNSIGMKFRLIPPGEFLMGSTPEEIEAALVLTVNDELWQLARRSEGPRHRVRLTQPIYLGTYEVTQSQFAEVVGRTPAHFASGGAGKDFVADVDTRDHPVEMVRWDDAQEFCKKLRERERHPGGDQAESPGGNYRLPTEAEWEFACRAGTSTVYWSGNDDADVVQSDWIAANADGRTHAVGQRQSNPLGLFDTHGNVSEWVQDWWDPFYYGQFAGQTAIDPTGPASPAARRVLRGGAWHAAGHRGRAAVRHATQPSNHSNNCGFRVALDIDAVRPSLGDPATSDLALDFNGQSNWVHIPTLSTDGTHPLTVECWINPRRIEGNQPAIKMAGPGSLGLHIGQDHIVANCFQAGGAHGVRLAATDERDRWSHVACVWDGAEFRLYRDGRRCGESFPTKAKPHDPRMTMLGGCPPELNVLTSAAGYFDGQLNEVRFSNVARYADDFTPETRFTPDADTLALYHCDEGAGEVLGDSSGHGHHGKIVGAKWVRIGDPLADSTLVHAWPADAPPPAIAPFDAAQAKAHQEAWAKHLGVPVEYINSIGMKFRLIPPGEFLMGSSPEEMEAALKVATDSHWQDGIKSEAPRHQVILTRPIYLAVHEVTQGQYEKLIGMNPSFFAPTGAGKDAVAGMDATTHPVEMVSWNDAVEFCSKLSQQENLKPSYSRVDDGATPLAGNGYRLPTEAEWEFACRAGTTTRHWVGDSDEQLIQGAWFGSNGGGRTHAVGELIANPFGLHDTQGSIWEWVQDGWEANYYRQFQQQPAVDPTGPAAAESRVLRGGHWYHAAAGCRASFRYDGAATERGNTNGFRVALPVDAVRPPPKD